MAPHIPTLPPTTDPEMWASILNLLYWLERDEEFLWLQSVRDALVAETESEEAA
jgi:hypothetical protein